MASLQTLAKDTAIYGLSSIIGRFLNYLLVPLYTYTLKNCADYGIANDLYAQTALVLVILTFGMETTFFRFANKEEHPEEVFSTALVMVGCVSLVFVAGVLGMLPTISTALGYANHPWFIGLMALVVAQDAVQAIIFALLRYQKRPIRFASLKIFFIFLNCILNALAFAWLPKWIDGWEVKVDYMFYINIACTTTVSFLFLPELVRCKWKFNKHYCAAMLRYTWPMLILGIAGILNQVAGQFMLPRCLEQEAGRHALGIYGACVKIAMIMALITQAFRFAYEPIVFAGHNDKNNPEMLAKAMKYFIIFTLLAFLCVMGYLDILQRFVGTNYREGLAVVPIVMVAEIMMGISFNLSFWYKLTDRAIWGAWLSGAGCLVLISVNYFFIPQFGYMACAWAGVAGYATTMLLSYLAGQHYFPVKYPLGEILFYALLTAACFAGMHFSGQALGNMWLRMAVNTLIILAFVGVVIKRDLPLSSLPVVGKYFSK